MFESVRSRPLRGTAATIGVALLLLAACGGGGGGDADTKPVGKADQSSPGRRVGLVEVKTLSSPKGEQFRYRQRGRTITVTAPASNQASDPDLRLDKGTGVIGEAFWPVGQKMATDRQVCVQLDSVVDASSAQSIQRLLDDPTTRHLPGIALRIRPGEDGAQTYAITVTQRLGKAAIWGFDVMGLRIDSRGSRATAKLNLIGIAEFGDVVGTMNHVGTPDVVTTMKPPPWHLCGRAVGTKITLKLWPDDTDEPSWSDPDATREIELDRKWVFDGYAGAYEQGLSPGRSSSFTDLEVTSPY